MLKRSVVQRIGILLLAVGLAAGCGGGGGDGGGGGGSGAAAPQAQGVDAFVAAVDAVIATANADDAEPHSTANTAVTQDDSSEPSAVKTN